jgi:hypothetical protein
MKSDHLPLQTVPFLDFWVSITEHLGDAHGVIDPKTKTTQALFSSFDDQLGLLKNVILESYALNKCHHIKSPLNVNTVLDILGSKAFELHLKQADDLLDIELLEEICWLICQHFSHLIEIPVFNRRREMDESNLGNTSANIISLPKTKIRIANSKL